MKEYNFSERVQVLTSGDPKYPGILKEIRKPPKQLFYIGNIGMLNEICVAVVGSRTSTLYGRNVAKQIGRRLAEKGVTVISGMALGIDSCAHIGALEAAGFTAAVLGCGVDRCYPPENFELKAELERKGLVLSEYPPGTAPERYNFPERNRIISGLCQMTVVVQARNRSGALITAEQAADQGREIMAVPGNIDSQYNLGNNKLIKEGAMPLICIDDILEPLGLNGVDPERAKARLSNTEFEIYNMIRQKGEMSIDEICMNMGRDPSYVNPILSVMEMKGFTCSALGKIFLANM
ncbi:MAG: DNA-processing protein DprA [Eubacteriales bacterium]|nr:DNA-processing protein DprA [Eubacteriales bacterium]